MTAGLPHHRHPHARPRWHTVTDLHESSRERFRSRVTETEAAARLARHGRKVLAASHGRSGLSILLHQFKSLILILLVAATIVDDEAAAPGDRVDMPTRGRQSPRTRATPCHGYGQTDGDGARAPRDRRRRGVVARPVIVTCSLAPAPIVETAKLARRWVGRVGASRPQPPAEGRL